MGTTTTIVKPNYTYAGGPARTVRQDSMFQAPRLTIGGPRQVNAYKGGDPRRYGVYGGKGTPETEHQFFTPTGELPKDMSGGNNGAPITNPSVAPAAQQQASMFQGKYGTAPVEDPPPVKVAQKSQRAPIVTNDGGDNEMAAILSGVASMGNAVSANKAAASNEMASAGVGIAPGKADTSMMGKVKDHFTGMFGGPTRANIDAAYKRSAVDPAAIPGAPQLEGGDINGMTVGKSMMGDFSGFPVSGGRPQPSSAPAPGPSIGASIAPQRESMFKYDDEGVMSGDPEFAIGTASPLGARGGGYNVKPGGIDMSGIQPVDLDAHAPSPQAVADAEAKRTMFANQVRKRR